MIYFSLFSITLIISIFALDRRRFPIKQVTLFLFTLILLIVGFRYASVDYFQYMRIYESITDIGKLGWFIYEVSPLTPIESGYALLALIEKSITSSFYVFIFIIALLSISIKYYAFKVMSAFPIISILIYLSDEFFWKDMGQMRNALASSIVLVTIIYIHRSELYKYILLLVSAISMHTFAFIATPLYFLKRFNKLFYLWFSLIFSMIVAAFGGLGVWLVELGYLLGLSETSRLIKHYYYGVEGISFMGGTFILHVIICLSSLILWKHLTSKSEYNYLLIPMYIYGTVIMFLFIDYGIIAGRARELLCVPALTVFLPSYILLFKKNSRLIPYTLIVAYCLVWFMLMMQGRSPYQSILFI